MDTNEDYNEKLLVLNYTTWNSKILGPQISVWLENFSNDEEKSQALYLLSRMMYFNASYIRRLLAALYRDLYRYPIIKKIRQKNNDTMDETFIEIEFKKHLDETLFLGLGRISESGGHLLYYFRQETGLGVNYFATVSEVIEPLPGNKFKLKEEYQHIKHFVFIDDVCGSGSQASSDESNMKKIVLQLRNINPDFQISYYMLFGSAKGLRVAREAELIPFCKLYTDVRAVIELDETYCCFGAESRYFDEEETKAKSRSMAFKYGFPLSEYMGKKKGFSSISIPSISEYAKDNALGCGDCEFLLSMEHNTPDNTLPIIWFDEDEHLWKPIFRRYNKV